MQSLLQAIEQRGAKTVILDVTGVPIIDTAVARALLQASASIQLLGAKAMMVGLRPELVQTIVGLGLDLSKLETHANLQSGIRAAMRTATRSGGLN
jgi:anti-anti-sigma regulatory factor